MIRSFRSRALKGLWEKNDVRRIRPDWVARIRLILSALQAATRPEDLDLPGLNFHALSANLAGRFAVSVSRNWRITFEWTGQDAAEVDLEDYHGR